MQVQFVLWSVKSAEATTRRRGTGLHMVTGTQKSAMCSAVPQATDARPTHATAPARQNRIGADAGRHGPGGYLHPNAAGRQSRPR
jgi:hypothetical protein